jgi:hypothetical protein
MSEALFRHGDDLVLLRFSDGELSPDGAQALRAHLAECSECQRRLAEIRAAGAVYQEFHRDDLKANHPAPPRAWEDLRPSLDELDSSILRARGRNPWTWLAVAAVLAIGFVVWTRIGRSPSVSAAELLRKAADAASRHADARRRIQIRAHGKSVVRAAVAAGAAEGDLAPLFVAARYSWEEPLSARSFEQWRDQLPEKQDQVSRRGASYEIRTTTHSSTLTEAVLVLEAGELRPIRERMRFGSEVVELSEADPEAPSAARVAPPVPAPSPKAPPLPALKPGAAAELHVFAALHRISADLGEPVEVSRSDDGVVVTGTGLSPEREQQVRDAIRGVAGAVARFAKPQAGEVPPLGEKSAVAASTRSDLGDRLGEEAANRALDGSEAVMARAHALRALAQRFSSAVEAQLDEADRRLLLDLVRDHNQSLEVALSGLEASLAPALPAATPAASGPSANWQARALRTFEEARRVDQLLNTALSGTGASLTELSASLQQLHAEVRAR